VRGFIDFLTAEPRSQAKTPFFCWFNSTRMHFRGITRAFRASSNTGLVALRIFQGDKAEDKRAIPGVLTGIVMHPLAEYYGQMKIMEWSRLREVPGAPHGVIIEAAKNAEGKLVNAICQ
jgi:hypothetical protein